MKIIYIHQYFNFPNANGGTRSYDLATQFVKNGCDVEIITTAANIPGQYKKKWTQIERDGLNLHILNLHYENSFGHAKRIFVFLKFLVEATLKCLSIKTDIVVATSTPLTIGIPALLKRVLQRTPYVFEVRDVWPETVIAVGAVKNPVLCHVLRYLELIIYRHASAIVPLSRDMQSSIAKRHPRFINKMRCVIENIAEVERFGRFELSDEVLSISERYRDFRFTILYAGAFGKVNGLQYAVDLAEHVFALDKTIAFILIGKGKEKSDIEESAKRKGILNKNIFIFDPVSKNELPHLYSTANMGSSFVINIEELWANSANKFFDTLAASKPVLINYGGWQKETIETNDIGYVLPPHLDRDAARAFIEYTRQEEQVRQQCKNALSLAKESYSLNVAASRYMDILTSTTGLNT